MLDIAEDRISALSFSVSGHLLNRSRQTTTEADAEQTAVGGTLEPNLDCGLYTDSGIQCAITNAYATMTSLTATTTAARN